MKENYEEQIEEFKALVKERI